MIHNVVEFGNILCMSFESFGELYFRPTFDAGAVRRCIAIVRAIQADCLANADCDETPQRTHWNVIPIRNVEDFVTGTVSRFCRHF